MKTLRIAFCVLRSTCRARFLHKDMQDIRTTRKIQDTTYHKICKSTVRTQSSASITLSIAKKKYTIRS